MANEFTFSITTTRFDEDYSPSDSSRLTTNFANLARGEHRQQNLRNALTMIDRRFIAQSDNVALTVNRPEKVELEFEPGPSPPA